MATLDFSEYDKRNYPMVEPKVGYAAWSRFYDDRMTTHMDIDLLARVESIDWAAAGSAADLACGTGRIGAWLRDRGVEHIDGIDLTHEMLDHAHAKSVYRKLVCEDMRKTSLPADHYDLVTNSLSVEHIDDLEPLYREAGRLVVRSGAFALVAYHPVFMLRGIPTHFEDESGTNTSITTNLHLISDHVAAARRTGWQLAELHERVVDAAWLEDMPNFHRHQGWPISFAAVWRRGSQST